MSDKEKKIEGNLVPTLRQGIDIIKMVLFKELKPYLEKKYSGLTPDEILLLTGAIVNGLFGIENMEASIREFINNNQSIVEKEVTSFTTRFDHLQIPLNDALRIQYLCNSHEGVNSESILKKAETLQILMQDREVPMPGAFMGLVRSFGVAYKILEPIKPESFEKGTHTPENG